MLIDFILVLIVGFILMLGGTIWISPGANNIKSQTEKDLVWV
ncbi:hypothetical protein [Leuconostoc gelidum]|nr:hypothetical protein [Leuconostoc gelidum]